MKHLLTILTFLILISCKEDKQPLLIKPQNTADTIVPVNKKMPKEDFTQYKATIKNKSLYPKEWVAKVQKEKYPFKITVIDDHMIVDDTTVAFPDLLRLNKEYVFIKHDSKAQYELKVTRFCPTSVRYDFMLTDNGKPVHYSGEAHIGILFFLGSESSTDDDTGEGFLGDEYYSSTKDSLCTVSILIGDPDDKGRLRAGFGLYCENETQNSKIRQDVTLREHIE